MQAFTTGRTWSARSGTMRAKYGGMAGMGDWSAADQDDADFVYGPAFSTTSGNGNFQASDSFWQSLPGLAQKALAFKQALDIGAINKDRVARGLPPLTNAQMEALAPRVNVGLSASTQNTAMIIAGVVVGAIVLNSVLKHRR